MIDTEIPELGLFVGPDEDPDRYELITLEGAGSEGYVYRAVLTHEGVRHDVAAKMLGGDRPSSWRRQIELLRSLHHPAIVPVREGFVGLRPHAPGDRGGDVAGFLVMNWVDGEPLDDLIHANRLGARAAFELLVPIAEALELCHGGERTGGVPIVHRDVKPSNIVVHPERGAVLVDFGVSTTPGAQGPAGSPSFRAPEWQDPVVAPPLDIYGVGATAAFILLGERPSEDPARLRDQLMRSSRADISPLAVVRVLELCDPDPQQRPSNMSVQLRSILDTTEWRDSRPASEPAQRVASTTPSTATGLSRRTAIVLAVAAAALIAAVSFVALHGGDDGDSQTPVTTIGPPQADRCEPEAYRQAAADAGISWADPDGDCLDSRYEINTLGSDPDMADTDGDGTIDSLDQTTCSNCGIIPPVEQQAASFVTD